VELLDDDDDGENGGEARKNLMEELLGVQK